MNDRQRGMWDAAMLCRQYASRLHELPNGNDVALECAAIIEEACVLAPTIAEIGDGSCQELSSFLVAPEIDYTSGLLRK